jgi:hypothetical protein
LAGAAVFALGGYLAWRSLNLTAAELRWGPLLLAVGVGVPLTALANAYEYRVSAIMLGHTVGLLYALRISILATAANLLPIPGSALVRVQALEHLGSGYRRAMSATVVLGGLWMGVAALAAGVWLLAVGSLPAGGLLTGLAALVGGGAIGLLRSEVREPRRQVRLGLLALGVEVASVTVSAFRLLLVLMAIGAPAALAQALILTVAAVLASAVGLFPGGLGLRELLAALFAPLVDLTPGQGFLTTALDRVVGTLALGVLAAGLMFAPPTRWKESLAAESVDSIE